MTTNHGRRLATLAESLHPLGRRHLTESERDFLQWLSKPSLPHVVSDFARVKAERRWLHEHDRRAFVMVGKTVTMNRETGWSGRTTEDERKPYVRRELDDLGVLLGRYPLRDALQQWSDETERLEPYWHETDYAALSRHIDHERDIMTGHRTRGDLAKVWRAKHPEWRPDSTTDEYDAWETGLLADGADA